MNKKELISAINEYMVEADYMAHHEYLTDKHPLGRARNRLKSLVAELKEEVDNDTKV